MIYHGDCLEVLRILPDCSVDAVVTDPPYGLSFLGKKWDYDVPSEAIWEQCLRVLKPGGHLLAFAGTRTQHRMAVRIEDAGFEIRDMIAWVYGSGFPKSHNLRDEWQGWGTALKPALEPITVARKPLEGTVAENVLKWHTGAVNVDGCRVPGALEGDPMRFAKTNGGEFVAKFDAAPVVRTEGRWPANLIHDGSEEVLAGFPDTGKSTGGGKKNGDKFGGGYAPPGDDAIGYGDTGSAARFFYCAKASKKDRDAGLEYLQARSIAGVGALRDGGRESQPRANVHPTVKPTDLMRYLCRLVTPPGGVVLDPFMGSGSTGKAAILEGFSFIGIEREAEYVEIAKARIALAQEQPKQESLF